MISENDWGRALDKVCAERDELKNQLDSALHSIDVLERNATLVAKPLPRTVTNTGGWTIPPSYLAEVNKEVRDDGWDIPCIEVTEIIMLSAESRILAPECCAGDGKCRFQKQKGISDRNEAFTLPSRASF